MPATASQTAITSNKGILNVSRVHNPIGPSAHARANNAAVYPRGMSAQHVLQGHFYWSYKQRQQMLA